MLSEVPLDAVEMGIICDKDSSTEINIADTVMQDFCAFLQEKKEFLEDGLGVFHTDNHANW